VLIVGSETIELERKDIQTWAPVQRPYVLSLLTTYTHRGMCVYRDISSTSQVRVEIQMKSSHLPFAKKDRNVKEIGLHKLFDEYWASGEHETMVPGRSYSPTSLSIPDTEAQRSLSLESIVTHLNYTSLRALRFVSCDRPLHPANDVRIGGNPPRLAQRTRGIVKGTLHNDGCTDREDCGQGYQVRGCLRRGQSSQMKTGETLTLSS